MHRSTLGKVVLSFVLTSSSIVSVAVDWNETHLFNPAWPAHARFHDAVMLALLCGASVLGMWAMWREAREPLLGTRIATWIVFAFWSPFLYITWLIPGTSLKAAPDMPVPVVAGIPIYPNAAIAVVEMLLAWLGWWLVRSAPAAPETSAKEA